MVGSYLQKVYWLTKQLETSTYLVFKMLYYNNTDCYIVIGVGNYKIVN